MDGICNLLRPVLESGTRDQTLKNFLLSCVDQRAFSKVSGIAAFIGSINSRLNEPSSRNDGLLLLQSFLPQCPQDILIQNGNSWLNFCLRGMSLAKTARLSFVVFKMLLKMSATVPELSKYVSSIVIGSFAEQIHQGILPQTYVDTLECLELCMQKFNGPCGPHRKVIEPFLLSLLDYCGPQQPQVIWRAARCVALLPQIGGGGVGGAQYKLAWAAQQESLCRTIHIILDALYANTNELQVSLTGGMLEGIEPLKLSPIDEEPVLLSQKLVARLGAVSSCLQAMLIMAYPVPKKVALTAIMNLICRGLAVTGSSIGESTTTHSLALAAILPNIHHTLLKLLEALILLARTNLLPFAGLVCRLSVQTLKWTQVDGWPYGTEKPYSDLRIQAYRILKLWCGTAKGGSLVEDVSQQFVDLALQDIFSEKDTVSLSMGLPKKNQRHLKRKGAASPGVVSGAGMSRDVLSLNDNANKDVCVAALQALTAVVMSASYKLQAGLHKVLQETVVTILLGISVTPGESPIPYSEASPRLELYRLLLQLILDGHTVWPAPTNIALKLFSRGLHDADSQISMFCGIALSSAEKMFHPAYPSLNCAPSQKELEACVDQSQKQERSSTIQRVNHSNGLGGADEELESDDVVSAHSTAASLCNGLSGSTMKTISSETNEMTKVGNQDKSLGKPMPLHTPLKAVSSEVNTLGLKSSPASVEKEPANSNDDKNQIDDVRRTIDLTASDLEDNDDDICEIDLADSEDEKNSVYSCQTVDIPVMGEKKGTTLIKAVNGSNLNSKLSVPSVEISLVDDSADAAKGVENGSTSDSLEQTPEVSAECPKSPEVATESNKISEKTTEGEKTTEVAAEGVKRAAEAEDCDSACKKIKVTDEVSDFPSDEDSMLLSFVDVTRDEEEEEEEDDV